ncbi:MAG TPA: YegP family protein [Thermoanaerobaculia bacterium]|nr:YegP family protein [Thermoanaerobaculia bacterium]
MASAFVLTKNTAAKFRFNLRAGNNEIILTSEQYETKSGALNGIASVRKNAPDENRYVRKTATNGSPYFVLTAANGEIIGTSELYSTSTARDNSISAVMKTAPDAPLVDNT